MKSVRSSDRGPAVEDIQRRLLALGYELGPTGVDGVFLGRTAEAVRSFQEFHHLAENGMVGDETWAALVDAGFMLGDRMLYLRMPHFHGRDVRVLQQALSVLGFACGAIDAIFGAFTESALRDFQSNAGLPADGIAGPETARAIVNLRHVWEGKDPAAHSAAHIASARAASVLARVPVLVAGDDIAGARIAHRLVNLAYASTPESLMRILDAEASIGAETVVLHICGAGSTHPVSGTPLIKMDDPDLLAMRLVTALNAICDGGRDIVVEVGEKCGDDEREDQRAAVLLLDALCSAFD